MTELEQWKQKLAREEDEGTKDEIRAVIKELEEEARPAPVKPTPAEINLPKLPDSKDIRERARAVEDDIFSTYYKIMMDVEAPPAVRKACADSLADRARGKAEQSIKQTIENKTGFAGMTTGVLLGIQEELRRSIEEIRAAGAIHHVGGTAQKETGSLPPIPEAEVISFTGPD